MTSQLNLVILSLGANLERPRYQIESAYNLIRTEIGPILKQSSFFETEAWGFEAETKFLNTVIFIESKLDLSDLLVACKSIESRIGRKPKTQNTYESRLIDIDIIDFSGLKLISKDLTVPHSQAHKRRFVLDPLNEILPEWKHPVFGKNCQEMIEELSNVSDL